MLWVLLILVVAFILIVYIYCSKDNIHSPSFRTNVKFIQQREKERECGYFYDFDDDELTLNDLEEFLADEDFDLDSDWDDDEEEDDLLLASNSRAESCLSCLKLGQEYYFGTKTISVSRRNGYTEYPIVGIRFRGLYLTDIGRFEGYAKAETNNKYDDYAISVFREDHTQLGYIPAGNIKLHNYILSNGGYVHCLGYIAARSHKSFYGGVAIESNKFIISNRNKEYDTVKYYNCKADELKEFLAEKQS